MPRAGCESRVLVCNPSGAACLPGLLRDSWTRLVGFSARAHARESGGSFLLPDPQAGGPSLRGGRRGGGGAAWIWGGVRGKASVCAPTQPASSYRRVTRAGPPPKAQVSALKSQGDALPRAARGRPEKRPGPGHGLLLFPSLLVCFWLHRFSLVAESGGCSLLAALGSLMAVPPLVAALGLWTGTQAPQLL